MMGFATEKTLCAQHSSRMIAHIDGHRCLFKKVGTTSIFLNFHPSRLPLGLFPRYPIKWEGIKIAGVPFHATNPYSTT